MNYFLTFVFFFIISLLNQNQVSAQPTYSEPEEFIPCPRCDSIHTVKNVLSIMANLNVIVRIANVSLLSTQLITQFH